MEPLGSLDDFQVMLVLAHLSHDLRETEPPAHLPTSQTEGLDVLAGLADALGRQDLPPAPSNDDAARVGRELLQMMLNDPTVEEQVLDLLTDPPGHDQMSIVETIGDGALIAAILTWLQVRLSLTISRDNDGTKFLLDVDKRGFTPEQIARLAALIERILRLKG